MITPGIIDLTYFKDLIGKDNPVILDIGCNDGSHTMKFLELFNEAKVYSFEPDSRAIERYRNKVKDKRAKLFDIAISDIDGTTEFYVSGTNPDSDLPESPPENSEDLLEKVPEGWEGLREKLSQGWDESGSIRKPKLHLQVYPWCTFNEKIEVKTKKLDTWCQEEEIQFIDLIWADVQGAEINLIKGGSTALKHTHYFYTEYSDLELYEGQINLKELLELLPDFELLYRYSDNVLLKNKRKGQN
ncbi:FkbM family methyltransferase [Nostoc sp.]